MAVLKRLCEYEETSTNMRYSKGDYPLGEVVIDIVREILETSPELVIDAYTDKKRRQILESRIIKILEKEEYFAIGSKMEMIKKVFDFMFGYGQLQEYIDDEDISDIDGVRYNRFSIKKNGKRYAIDLDFGNERNYLVYCKLIALRNGGILNDNDSHCRVADIEHKLRINISIYPRNISGSAICIRKHRNNAYTMDDLMLLGMLDSKSRDLIAQTAESKKTMIICGKGGSGKTTLLRAIINDLPDMERVLIVESDAELYPRKDFCIEQRVKRSNEGGNPITLDMLIKDGLTMSLDTYCIGEIIGSEAIDFIDACCSGHRFFTTMHADKAQDCANRIVALAKSSDKQRDETMLARMFTDGVDMVIHMKDFTIDEILNVKSYDIVKNEIIYERIYSL